MIRFRTVKRIICIVLAAALSLSILSGCGDGIDHNERDGITKLRWVAYDAYVPDDIKEIVAAANAYSAEKIGITVELEVQPSEMINLVMASGEYYDMIFTSEWLNNYDKAAAKGMFYDITELVKSETPELYDIIGDYWECAELNGRIYGVPTLKDMGCEMMYRFNSDYFEGEKGMEIPEHMTFADVEKYAEAYKKDFPYKYPLAMTKSGIAGMTNFLERIVGNVLYVPYNEDEPRVKPIWECDELMERFRLLHKWYKLGYIHPDASALESSAIEKDVPIRFGVAWRGYKGYSNPADWGFNVKTSIYDGPYLSRSMEQGALMGICAGCSKEHAKAALKYIELLNTDRKFRDIFAFGIEGKHFEYLENGTVLRTQQGVDHFHPSLYPFGSVVNASCESVSRDFLADPDLWEKVYEGYKEYGIYSKLGGFVYDTTRKEDIIATVTAIYLNYSTDLITGTSDPDEVVPKMRSEMEAAGINELIEDVQGCLDEFRAKQK